MTGVRDHLMPSAPTPTAVLHLIRDLHPDLVRQCQEGSCFKLHLLLRELFPGAEPWYDGDHVIARIGSEFYDIRGVVLPSSNHRQFNDAERFNRAHSWSAAASTPEASRYEQQPDGTVTPVDPTDRGFKAEQVTQHVYASPIFTLAIDALNKTKAWRDCDGNDGFPHEVREQIDAVLMAYELRAARSRGESR